MKKRILFLGLYLSLSAPSAWALRCGSLLVDTGDYKLEVLRKCGEPVFTDSRIELRYVKLYGSGLELGQYVPVMIDEWTYDFGPNRFVQLLRFENGRLVDIESLGYGR
ncbi:MULTISPECIES: DUF2845 domain-containing protein [Methylocaldum]|jgi:hypothetical protein|uniref:DUF2845 domain-containing protein n=1 Tax=unclassified Methylocaldum TaxID=2622260 RepID=UPI00098AFE34|nr:MULTISPECIES: DUF2845 domain-containing protein [unclassified Methylocaldum]MBP1149950.1 hypothetical protein [Methylocaldum sp. RMAD-M]MDV3242653.1 DUF2845 domain-containing protein [Methylocaldum sp.]MVF21151.1 DUF2845 domain-containing protein [Methylocaldum sp. BRCS4]